MLMSSTCHTLQDSYMHASFSFSIRLQRAVTAALGESTIFTELPVQRQPAFSCVRTLTCLSRSLVNISRIAIAKQNFSPVLIRAHEELRNEIAAPNS
jgi:hypothetical protein